MSFVEIKEQVAGLSPDERLELAAFIAHLARADDPRYQADLDRRLAEIDLGKGFTVAPNSPDPVVPLATSNRQPVTSVSPLPGFPPRAR